MFVTTLRDIAQLGHPVLKTPAHELVEYTSEHVRTLIDDMLFTVAKSNGVGLAAPQVYESLRLIIVSSHPNKRYPYAPFMEPTVMINPEVVYRSEIVESDWEGCLSVPGIRGLVPRAKTIGLKFTGVDGNIVEDEYSGFLARVVQHEIDHLDGISFLERVENMKDIMTDREFKKLIEVRDGAD